MKRIRTHSRAGPRWERRPPCGLQFNASAEESGPEADGQTWTPELLWAQPAVAASYAFSMTSTGRGGEAPHAQRMKQAVTSLRCHWQRETIKNKCSCDTVAARGKQGWDKHGGSRALWRGQREAISWGRPTQKMLGQVALRTSCVHAAFGAEPDT